MTVTCTNTNCPINGLPYDVPDDGFPVTCGGCNATLTGTPA